MCVDQCFTTVFEQVADTKPTVKPCRRVRHACARHDYLTMLFLVSHV